MSNEYPQHPSYPGPTQPGDGSAAHPSVPDLSTQGHVQPHVPTEQPRHLGALTAWTIATAVSVTTVPLVGLALVWDARATWLDAAANGRSALDVVTPYELSWILLFPLTIATYVVTCLWLYRARTNVDVLSPGSWHARSRGWVWGGWVVPFVSLWFPFQVVRDVLRSRERPDAPTTGLGWWWAAWIVAMAVSQIESNMTPWDDIDVAAVDAIPIVSTIGAVTMVIACVLWIRVVLAVAQDQRALLERAGVPSR